MKHRGKPQHIPLALLLLAIWFDLTLAWGAEAPKPMRAIIVFDISGSMRHNDPQRLSVMAAQLFVDLAQSQDALGLVAFSDRGVPLVPVRALAHPSTRTLLQTSVAERSFSFLNRVKMFVKPMP